MAGAAPARSLRGRLLGAFAVVAAVALLIAGAVTLAFARTTAYDAAQHDLRDKADAVIALLRQGQLARERLPALRGILRLEDAAVVPIGPAGAVAARELPAGLDPGHLDPASLLAGRAVAGRDASLVFVAVPFQDRSPGGTVALVLTRDVGGLDLRGLGPYLLAAGGLALVGALVVAGVVARRLSRPLAAMQATAAAIAAGDLSARVGTVEADRELHALARALDTMAAELERSRATSRDFLMSVSHDLRTPLTSIRGYAEALADDTAADATARRRAAAVIESEARRLERLVSDLLDLARLDARQFSLDVRPVDAGSVVRDAAGAFAPTADEMGIALRVRAPRRIDAPADPERLGQVVANLVENALKYAAGAVEVRVRAADGSVLVEVSDDGPGINPDDLPRVFERLYTSRRVAGRQVGTGLGLAIVHELMTAMGGTVAVDAPPHGGARFTVTLPRATPRAGTRETQTDSEIL